MSARTSVHLPFTVRRWLVTAAAVPVWALGMVMPRPVTAVGALGIGVLLGWIWAKQPAALDPGRDPLVVDPPDVSVTLAVPEIRQALTVTMTALEQTGAAMVGEIAALSEQAAAQTDELTVLVDQNRQANVDFAESVLRASAAAAHHVQAAGTTLGASVEALQALLAHLHAASEKHAQLTQVTGDLRARTDAIRDIARTVGDIARRASLLALNASIEAARSGTHGAGFAVVAAEFRQLADSTQTAASQIRDLLTAVDQGICDTVRAVDDATGIVERYRQVAADTGDRLQVVQATMAATTTTTETLHGQASAYAAAQNGVQVTLDGLSTGAQALQTTVFALFEHLQSHDVCRQHLARADALLSETLISPAAPMPSDGLRLRDGVTAAPLPSGV